MPSKINTNAPLNMITERSLKEIEVLNKIPSSLPLFVGLGPDYPMVVNRILNHLNRRIYLSSAMLSILLEEYLDNIIFEDGDDLISPERVEPTVKWESVVSFYRQFVPFKYDENHLFFILFRYHPLYVPYIDKIIKKAV